MEPLNRSLKVAGRSLFFTTIFCLIISVITKMIWSGAWFHHIVISLGYGYSAVASAHLLMLCFPNITLRQLNLLSVAGAMTLGTGNAYFWLNRFDQFNGFSDLQSVIILGFIFTLACFFYFYAHEQKLVAEKQLEVSKRKQADQEKTLLLSKLNQLQSQIEPHFLFNTLANISVLIETDPDSAKKMLQKLTDLLRATLNKSRSNLVTLQDELDLVEAYLGIQQVRLSERLSYQIDTDVDNTDVMLPPLLLQPLVENAVQHGVEPSAKPGHISVSVKGDEQALQIVVADTGVGFNCAYSTKGNGVALDNIRQRLKTLFDGQAELELKEGCGTGVVSEITINAQALKTLKTNNGM
ncbi:sensor histidine kinase [Vibrio sonorensis]|uniref:sensor histidine kinase n=1 Tax=Vibrio sonorensis TaxID=1004316 RepID=UPI0008D9B189|nr:histidine kinase [Vibrio sonorensis]